MRKAALVQLTPEQRVELTERLEREEVNRIAADDEEVIRLRKCIERGTPFGSESWSSRAVASLGLESSVRPRGRPRKIPAAE